MAGNKFRTIKKEKKSKFIKNSPITLLNDSKIYSKPSNKEQYSTNQIFQKDAKIKNIEDIIIQKDGVYAKIKTSFNNFGYIILSNDKNEEFAKIDENTPAHKTQNSKINYSTFGQIKLNDESLNDSTLTQENSNSEKSYKNFLQKNSQFLETTKFGFPSFENLSPFKGLIGNWIDTPFESLLKSTFGFNPKNECKLNFGERLLAMAEIGGIKSLVNTCKIFSKYKEFNLNTKINEQNILNIIGKYNKGFNDSNISKSENAENALKNLFEKENEEEEDKKNVKKIRTYRTTNVEGISEEPNFNGEDQINLEIPKFFNKYENENNNGSRTMKEPVNDSLGLEENFINQKKNKSLNGKIKVIDSVGQEFEKEYVEGKEKSCRQKKFKIIVIERALKYDHYQTNQKIKLINQGRDIRGNISLGLAFDRIEDKINESIRPHRGIIYGNNYYDFMDDGKIYCFPIKFVSNNEKNINLDEYDKEHFWEIDNFKVYFKKGNSLYERDKEYFYKYKKTAIEGFTENPIDKNIFNKFEGKYNLFNNNCRDFVKELCDHEGIK